MVHSLELKEKLLQSIRQTELLLFKQCSSEKLHQQKLSSQKLSKFNEKTLLFNKYFQFLKIIPRFILIYPPPFDQFFYITALAGGLISLQRGLFLLWGIICCSKKTVRLLSDGLSLAVLFLAVCYSVFFSSSTTLPSLSFSCKPLLVVW